MAVESATGADLKALAERAGLPSAGRKGELVDRLLAAGQAEPLARLVNRRGWYEPVAIGPDDRTLAPVRNVAGLWVAAWEDAGSPGLHGDEDPDPDSEPRWQPPAPTPPPEGAAWTVALGASVDRAQVIEDAVVVLTTAPEVCLVGADGRVPWRTAIEGVAEPELVSFVTIDGQEVAIDDRGLTSIAIHGDQILVGLTDRVVALESDTGAVAWTWLADADLSRPVVSAGDLVLVTTSDGLRAIDAGTLRWRFDRKDLSLPVVDEDRIVTMRAATTLNVLALDNGELHYRLVLKTLPKVWEPLVEDGLLLCGGDLAGTGVVGAIDLDTGEAVWSATGDRSRRPWSSAPPPRVRAAILALGERVGALAGTVGPSSTCSIASALTEARMTTINRSTCWPGRPDGSLSRSCRASPSWRSPPHSGALPRSPPT
ncbi:PQQ-binding-like beta-propeller repeat protein [Aquihabitans daechungensis]|uniref:outer membrane protein assembly factor BamB family protein n=1 Tax=Aquihabitans daechungensis TaxID=1052257 RepID=UPI003BA2A56D